MSAAVVCIKIKIYGQRKWHTSLGERKTCLRAQVEVAEQYGGLRAGDDQDNEDQEKESKHVVHLARPATQTQRTRTKH